MVMIFCYTGICSLGTELRCPNSFHIRHQKTTGKIYLSLTILAESKPYIQKMNCSIYPITDLPGYPACLVQRIHLLPCDAMSPKQYLSCGNRSAYSIPNEGSQVPGIITGSPFCFTSWLPLTILI